MDTPKEADRRSSIRSKISLSATIKGQESADVSWKETSLLTTVSKTGASFNLKKECAIGNLLSLILPMPTELRCYDQDSDFYKVWGLVQHCTPVKKGNFSGYHVGIAFIGKYAPKSYKENPLNSYRISGIGENGLWKIYEAPKAFISRKHQRFYVELDIKLTLLDSEENVISEEDMKTENISLSGAAVNSTLDAMVGDLVIFSCPAHNFSTPAIVRNLKPKGETASILHLEFIETEFPVREIFSPIKRVEEV
jgi:hypothetical protein